MKTIVLLAFLFGTIILGAYAQNSTVSSVSSSNPSSSHSPSSGPSNPNPSQSSGNPNPSQSSQPSPSANPNPGKGSSSSIATGTIVGIVIGVIAAIAISVVLTWYFFRRRLQRKQEQNAGEIRIIDEEFTPRPTDLVNPFVSAKHSVTTLSNDTQETTHLRQPGQSTS